MLLEKENCEAVKNPLNLPEDGTWKNVIEGSPEIAILTNNSSGRSTRFHKPEANADMETLAVSGV